MERKGERRAPEAPHPQYTKLLYQRTSPSGPRVAISYNRKVHVSPWEHALPMREDHNQERSMWHPGRVGQ